MKRGGSDLHEYKKAIRLAKEAIDTIREISDDMEEEYSERDEYEYEDMPKHRHTIRRYR